MIEGMIEGMIEEMIEGIETEGTDVQVIVHVIDTEELILF
jgi:hypothetical protein